jgi:transposase
MPSAITDELWAELEPLVTRAKRSRAGAPPDTPDRLFLEALLYLADSGCKWRQLPERFGTWDAVYNRFRRWLDAGVFERLFADLPPPTGLDGIRRVFIDSTTVRAHPHAAGAPAAKGGRRGSAWAGAGAGSRPRSTSPAPTSGRPSPSS